ncbi:hypothetical protein [Nonomuraea jiangxiensis]|uniref:Uncharacterized protein n=1 Tax=Nonomuraea jiangxiensis TaxID=633440 RepID=A0A1G8Q1W8_9ACTN|nr:hypothetical protein [Nonomuraea jiangxiensis]SDI98707.1 hypothetical protein SAMN05421869_108106 [Nonomuraea jiangxiensis]
MTFQVHGTFEGLPSGSQVIQYRLVGAEKWRKLLVPADHGPRYTTVLETLDWDDETPRPRCRSR